MAFNRWIYLDTAKRLPTAQELEPILRHFFGAFATSMTWEGQRWTVVLAGTHSFMFQHLYPHIQAADADHGRWIEVYVGTESEEPYLDVITRHGDCATSALADGLAERLARFYGAMVEAG